MFSNKIDLIINSAAYTLALCCFAALAKSSTAKRLTMLAFSFSDWALSTDYVFDGQTYRPYSPFDECRPLSVYGLTKRQGEEKILQEKINNSLIIRTAWVYSSYGNNFAKTILQKQYCVWYQNETA